MIEGQAAFIKEELHIHFCDPLIFPIDRVLVNWGVVTLSEDVLDSFLNRL